MYYAKREKYDYTLSASFISTLLISLNLITILLMLDYYEVLEAFSTATIVFLTILIWFLNYFIVVRKESFLKKNFVEDKKGGLLVIAYIILTGVLVFAAAKLNRDRIIG